MSGRLKGEGGISLGWESQKQKGRDNFCRRQQLRVGASAPGCMCVFLRFSSFSVLKVATVADEQPLMRKEDPRMHEPKCSTSNTEDPPDDELMRECPSHEQKHKNCIKDPPAQDPVSQCSNTWNVL